MAFLSKCAKKSTSSSIPPSTPENKETGKHKTWFVSMPNEISGSAGSAIGSSKLRCPAPISRLRVEKIEGGLMVAGVVVAANCQIILPIFGFLFLLVGCVLTAASYRGPGEDEDADRYEARITFTGNSRILGPACIVVGFFMLVAGFVLCVLTKRARRREQTIGFHCPLHGDFYPLSPLSSSRTIGSAEKGGNCILCWPRRRGPGAIAVGPPQCPHSQMSSTRSSIASSPHSQCPTPLPFLVNSGSVGVLVAPIAQMSPDQPFGSNRSLTGGREVASFPLSRTPTPPPSANFDSSPNLVHVPDEQNLVESHFEQVPIHRNDPRKSVSIVLPTEEKG
ncbi:uncharacterized protein LOC130902570 isoform X2 [Diorhabda carinulata]|uniref:uncharacterized protein LOC130445631 isoform X2 n=2 Tax=Diorhabda TaxID=217246 RepID=UPI0024E126A4|nr:uncharacterized protein LOC130445631 isoform X2 [Diorhabda sublineata]XP_056637379.1 uncharacterized protein LOC130445631 isoform X2 [Diorhabda sublineata]XP_057670779.1 uncharacterized protein LOC130902570 isoform X2 [Diorhabda carinulata]